MEDHIYQFNNEVIRRSNIQFRSPYKINKNGYLPQQSFQHCVQKFQKLFIQFIFYSTQNSYAFLQWSTAVPNQKKNGQKSKLSKKSFMKNF